MRHILHVSKDIHQKKRCSTTEWNESPAETNTLGLELAILRRAEILPEEAQPCVMTNFYSFRLRSTFPPTSTWQLRLFVPSWLICTLAVGKNP